MSKTCQQRINNIVGQLQAINRMIDEEKPSSDVLIQLKAAKSALGTVYNQYLEDNVLNCFSNCDCTNNSCGKLVKELIKS